MTSKRPNVKASKRLDVPPRRSDAIRADGREVRRKTLYLPIDCARALELRAVQDDTTESRIVEDALRAYLEKTT
jgi:hypothetical protein